MGSQPGRVMPDMGKEGQKAGEREKGAQKVDDKEGEHVRWQSCAKQHRNFSADMVTCPS